ncbi:Crp/Fnr family transcriptional regulator [Athalassotoga saccharophila]|uniref:Crp/Fnr family transcriptional regulator n=1 Tax=Athalassotoga saccharophila TaxID=1441386 RepID=UPI00137AC63A|nr:Crp/Fnr family transcriptional regulator [Athalassotoga saccharophila]BBJ28125.1 CRP-like cAMP-activated global transcriptional regulator [Athalassotoga saccharophila]
MDVSTIIQKSEYFSNFNAEMIGKLIGISRIVTVKKGETLFFEGEEGKKIYMVLSGKIKIFKLSTSGKEFVIKILKPGELFAESLLFKKEKSYPASSDAMDNSRVLEIDVNKFEVLLMNDNQMAVEIIKNLTSRLSYLSQRFENLIIGNSIIKMAFFLLDLAHSNGTKDGKNIKITLDMNREMMGNMLNLSRENVERTLRYFKDQNLISLSKDHVTILDIDKLKEMAMKT